MDKRLLRYAGGGGAISLVACGVIFALPGVVFGCAYGLYEALKGRDDPDA